MHYLKVYIKGILKDPIKINIKKLIKIKIKF